MNPENTEHRCVVRDSHSRACTPFSKAPWLSLVLTHLMVSLNYSRRNFLYLKLDPRLIGAFHSIHGDDI